jgi:hypothetical protein
MATARIGLVFHELVGHGGAALAMGGRILEVRLFWFAGGWIRYDLTSGLDEPSVAALVVVSMGGIAVELVLGAILWFAMRGDTLARRIARTIGATLVVHAGWYFATGTWHGYGDGALIYRLLGDARYPAAIAGAAVTCVAAFAGARHLFATLVATIGPTRRVAGIAIAMVVAGSVNLALDLGELAIRHDATYVATMASERDRVIARDYARWLDDARRSHTAIDDEARDRELHRLDRDNRTFPFAWLLGAAVAASVVAGAWRSRTPSAAPNLTGRMVAVAAVVAAGSIAVVIALDAVV